MTTGMHEDGTRKGLPDAAKDRWSEGVPEDAQVGEQPGLRNTEAFYQNRKGTSDLTPKQGRPLTDADFGDGSTFSKGTKDALKE